MEGWVRIHRKILDNSIVCKDSETFSIWLYLLLNATHKEIPATFKGQKITLEKGQLITGILSISKKLLINKDKVQRTLKCFELDKQIEQQTSNKNRLITILNWEEYQNSDKQIDKQMINKNEKIDKQIDNKQECNNNNIYFILFNKYSAKISGQNFGEKIKAINELKNEKDYNELLTQEEQDKLFSELMNIKGAIL